MSMANDVFTYVTYYQNKKWEQFTKAIAEIESSTEDCGMSQLMKSLFPEHHECDDIVYYNWDWDETGDVLDTKWCHIHQVDEGSIEFHSAWNAPTGLLNRICHTFGKSGFACRIEDSDWGVIGDVVVGNDYYFVKCLTNTYYNDFIKHARGRSKELNNLLAGQSFWDDDIMSDLLVRQYLDGGPPKQSSIFKWRAL